LALGVGGGTLGVVLRRACFELLLAGPLRRGARCRERGLGRGELGERALQRRRGTAPARLRLSHLLRERFQLGAALERPPASRRVVRTKSDKGPITASPNCSRALSSAWAAGASPTRSRSSSARASCRAVTCARASSAWRRAARPWVSCSLSSATRRRACSRP